MCTLTLTAVGGWKIRKFPLVNPHNEMWKKKKGSNLEYFHSHFTSAAEGSSLAAFEKWKINEKLKLTQQPSSSFSSFSTALDEAEICVPFFSTSSCERWEKVKRMENSHFFITFRYIALVSFLIFLFFSSLSKSSSLCKEWGKMEIIFLSTHSLPIILSSFERSLLLRFLAHKFMLE